MENKIPTAEEFFGFISGERSYPPDFVHRTAIEFAKRHVEAALKAASKKANMLGITQHNNSAPDKCEDFVSVFDSNGPDYGYTVNKDSILNAYPLTNIK